MASNQKIRSETGPAGGWGSVGSLARTVTRSARPLVVGSALLHQNKPDGFACVSCAWAKPAHPRPFEFCENGAKATGWELTSRRATPDFFASHTVAELEGWTDHDLESTGRLTHPLRWDAGSDRYLPIAWDQAFAEIGAALRQMDPRKTVFYTSGRASLEASYMYALFARMFGTNNLPDSSNMCHESTSVALPESLGTPVGTVLLEDFRKTEGIFFFGQNVGTSSPRMLHDLQEARQRDVPIVTFNPLRERGLERFVNPQNPTEMTVARATPISTQYHQVRAGGDIAAIVGMCKALLAMDALDGSGVIDRAFIARHTHGFEAFAEAVRRQDWAHLERRSGLTREAMEAAAAVYAGCPSVIAIYGMGVTQHREGVEAVQMIVNLLLLRGNIGRPGAGICPVRGHSNVQGQRTVGITEKPELAPLDRLKELYGFEPPRWTGLTTVDTCEGVLKGEIQGFVALGGNFVRAVPERAAIERAWRDLPLTVQISTKLNRSHVIHGRAAYVLPCLGRLEQDEQATGPQAVSMEDSTACIHGSFGRAPPAGPHLLSEPCIVARLAKAVLPPNPAVDWDGWVADYRLVRDAIERTYPGQFDDFNQRMFRPGGFPRPLGARQREWATKTGKANFTSPQSLEEDPDVATEAPDVFQLITLRSNGQFNTTVYSNDDRLRGIHGSRMVIMISPHDLTRLGMADGDEVDLAAVAGDGRSREVQGFRLVSYNIPDGCLGGYYPECNPLVPLWHHAKRSKVPAVKSVPVRLRRHAGGGGG